MTQLNFDAQQVEPQQPFEVLPAGWYNAIITESEMLDTKAGTGQYLQLTFQIVDGQYANRIMWARLNLVNQNATAVEIAQRELSAICHAIGVLKVGDSQELHNKPLQIKLKISKQEGFEDKNEISGYKPIGGEQQSFQPQQQPAQAPKQQAAASRPPWQQ